VKESVMDLNLRMACQYIAALNYLSSWFMCYVVLTILLIQYIMYIVKITIWVFL
jgi:hypothetical protein